MECDFKEKGLIVGLLGTPKESRASYGASRTLVVGVPGIEPELHDPQPCVLPLYYTPVYLPRTKLHFSVGLQPVCYNNISQLFSSAAGGRTHIGTYVGDSPSPASNGRN